ncbi:hypothetical protein M413DRAFT_443062 [Hebeloma cylindrosporum]|uniref:Uncharacterized protein n=1 Tax=Hebeloma cylindrosporum TaxID=76867 RepID=A0A0C3C561_HEBCY|nr:hypothetical protein M413DRAFT_443062 [Hebeloma cylindrosporum h7]
MDSKHETICLKRDSEVEGNEIGVYKDRKITFILYIERISKPSCELGEDKDTFASLPASSWEFHATMIVP